MAFIDARSHNQIDYSKLGEALGELLFPQRYREKQAQESLRQSLISRPDLLARASREPDFDAKQFAKLGIMPETVLQAGMLFPETQQEATDRELRKRNASGTIADATLANANAEIAESGLRQETALLAQKYKLPEVDAQTHLQSQEAASIQFGLQNAKNSMEKAAIDSYLDFAGKLPDKDKRMAVTALANPGYLNSLFQQESLDLQGRRLDLDQQQFNLQKQLAEASQSQNAQEMSLKLFGIRNTLYKEMDGIATKIQAGKLAPGELDVLADRQNQLAHTMINLFPGEAVPILDKIEKFRGTDTKSVQYRMVDGSDLVALRIAAGQLKLEDVQGSRMLTDAQKQNILQQVQQFQRHSTKSPVENYYDMLTNGAFNAIMQFGQSDPYTHGMN